MKIDGIAIPKYTYQENLTPELDKLASATNITMDDIYKITLWKVDRFPIIAGDDFLEKYNDLRLCKVLDEKAKQKATQVLTMLLSEKSKGIRLAMASTYLRFRNPHVFQILDQRVWRQVQLFKKQEELELKTPRNIQEQISLYLNYLEDLHELAAAKHIDYEQADRILYLLDIAQGRTIKY